MTTLEEALAHGQGVERPFRCTQHDDTQASASVNVLKGVWFCHACQASGTVDGKRAPKVEVLQAMLEPERASRVYPQAYLELFDTPRYWLERFPTWLCHAKGLGEDPFTGDATFPVHTPGGRLAGVGRRRLTPEKKSRYLYPRHWSASMTLFGTDGRYPGLPVVCLVEGAADAVSLWQVGAGGLAVYGAGIHMPQIELLVRYNPKVILIGFDMDEAGESAASRAFKQLRRIAPLARVYWPKKDPAECTPSQRRQVLLRAVGRTQYGVDVIPHWDAAVTQMKDNYKRFVEGAA